MGPGALKKLAAPGPIDVLALACNGPSGQRCGRGRCLLGTLGVRYDVGFTEKPATSDMPHGAKVTANGEATSRVPREAKQVSGLWQ